MDGFAAELLPQLIHRAFRCRAFSSALVDEVRRIAFSRGREMADPDSQQPERRPGGLLLQAIACGAKDAVGQLRVRILKATVFNLRTTVRPPSSEDFARADTRSLCRHKIASSSLKSETLPSNVVSDEMLLSSPSG